MEFTKKNLLYTPPTESSSIDDSITLLRISKGFRIIYDATSRFIFLREKKKYEKVFFSQKNYTWVDGFIYFSFRNDLRHACSIDSAN